MAQALAWLDGVVGPLAEARVPVQDRGFLFADGVYEVLRAYDGQLFAEAAHWDRLAASAAGIELTLPFDGARFGAIARDLLTRGGLTDAEVYVEVTRGVARRVHLFPADVAPTVLVWTQPLRPQDPAAKARGVAVVTLPDERWARCHLKTVSLLPNVLAKEQARQLGAFEAVLVRDGLVTEGTSCNVMLVKDGTLVTPLADHRILPGVTRARLLAIAAELGVPTAVRDVPFPELEAADEVFLTGTMIEVMPVASVNGQPIGQETPGPVTTRLARAFAANLRF